MSVTPKEKRANLLRATGFTIFLVIIVFSPFSKQVLHSNNPLLREWRMFGDVGIGLIDISFYTVGEDGNHDVLDRYGALGYTSKEDAPEWLWRIDSEEDLELLIVTLCNDLGEETDLRLEGRVATHDGWEMIEFSERNLCEDLTDVRN